MLVAATTQTIAQTKPPTATQPASAQTATTEAGRKVVLRSDGTWKYADVGSSVGTPTPVAGKGTLAIEAGLVFQSGDAKPVARTEFFLLDSSFTAVIVSSGIRLPRMMDSTNAEQNVLDNMAIALQVGSDEWVQFRATVLEVIRRHAAFSATTDFGGKAAFKNVKAGRYYLVGYTAVGRSSAVWNLPVLVKNVPTSVTLDNNNASVF